MGMLKNCPFCYGEAGFDETQKKYGVVYSVYCTRCGAEIQKLNSEESINAWNRRVE